MARLMQACRGPRALPAFASLSFLESSLVPVPIDLAMVPLCLARPWDLWKIIIAGTLGSVIGAVFGFLVGALFMDAIGGPIISLYGGSEAFERIRTLYRDHGPLVIALAGITPLPFQVATIAAGASAMSFPVFLAAALGIRLLRFALLALLIRICGAGFQKLLLARGQGFAVVMTLLAIAAVLVVPAIL